MQRFLVFLMPFVLAGCSSFADFVEGVQDFGEAAVEQAQASGAVVVEAAKDVIATGASIPSVVILVGAAVAFGCGVVARFLVKRSKK